MKSLFLHFCFVFLFPQLLLAGTEIPPGCNLPAPSNIVITSMGPDWAALKWDAVGGAWGYRVRALRMPSGIVDADVQTTNTQTSLDNLLPGATYQFTVAAICPNRIVSNYLGSITKTIIVLDIVLNQSDRPSCPLILWNTPDPLCPEAPWNNGEPLWGPGDTRYWLQISNADLCAVFKIEPGDNSSGVLVQRGEILSDQYEDDYAGGACTGGIQMSTNNINVTFSAGGYGNLGQLSVEKVFATEGTLLKVCLAALNGALDYTFYKEPFCGALPSIRERGVDHVVSTLVLLQNPAIQTLDFEVNMQQGQTFNFQLYDVHGRSLRAGTGPVGQRISLDVIELPAGVYYLKIHTATGVVCKAVQLAR